MKAADVPAVVPKGFMKSLTLQHIYDLWIKANESSKTLHHSPSGMTAKAFGLKCEEQGFRYDLQFVLDGEGGAYYTIVFLGK